MVSINKYFYIQNGEMYQISEKKQNARQILQQIWEHLTAGKKITYSTDFGFDGLVMSIQAGFRKKEEQQGKLYRIWQTVLTAFSYLGLYLSEAQKVHHYSRAIMNSPNSKRHSLLVENDTAKIKAALLKNVPSQMTQMEIINAPVKDLLQKKPQLEANDPAQLFMAAAALENQDPALAKQILLNLKLERTFLETEHFRIFSEAIARCLIQGDENGAKELISVSCDRFLFDSKNDADFDRLMQQCSKEGKLHSLMSILNTFPSHHSAANKFHSAYVNECIRTKDRNGLLLIDKIRAQDLEEAIKVLLDPADDQSLKQAYKLAEPNSWYSKGSLITICETAIQRGTPYEVAVDALNKIKDYKEEKIVLLTDQLTRKLLHAGLFALAEKALKTSNEESRLKSPLKELANDVFNIAMDKKEYSLAFEAASFPLFFKNYLNLKFQKIKQPQDCKDWDVAVVRIEDIRKLLPQGDDLIKRIETLQENIKRWET